MKERIIIIIIIATVPPHADELAADEMERGKNKEERRNELRTKTK
jgi:hypothetical protein